MSKKLRLALRCYADKEGDQWQAFCLDLNLAAQAASFDEARRKLHSMIDEYVYDALAGEDQEHADYLLSRKAPFFCFAKYYWYLTLYKIGVMHDGIRRLFTEPVRMPRAPYKHA